MSTLRRDRGGVRCFRLDAGRGWTDEVAAHPAADAVLIVSELVANSVIHGEVDFDQAMTVARLARRAGRAEPIA